MGEANCPTKVYKQVYKLLFCTYIFAGFLVIFGVLCYRLLLVNKLAHLCSRNIVLRLSLCKTVNSSSDQGLLVTCLFSVFISQVLLVVNVISARLCRDSSLAALVHTSGLSGALERLSTGILNCQLSQLWRFTGTWM